MVRMFQFDFEALVVGLSQIAGSHIDANPLRTGEIRSQDIVSLFVEYVDITVQQSVP